MPTPSPPAPRRNPLARYTLVEDLNALLVAVHIKSLVDKDAYKAEAHHL
jgi:hypothetical protein